MRRRDVPLPAGVLLLGQIMARLTFLDLACSRSRVLAAA